MLEPKDNAAGSLDRRLLEVWKEPAFRQGLGRALRFYYRITGLLGVLALMLAAYCLLTTPSREELERWEPALSSRVYDREGRNLEEYGRLRRHALTLEDAPPALIDALLSIEDREFYSHGGVDLDALPAALLPALWGDRARGASTLTQQLAKNAFLGPERSLLRKAREFIIAFRLESIYTKAELLELYLNTVYLGGGVQGFADAAWFYFGRSADSLQTGEWACLAGLLSKPEALRPDRFPEAAKARRNVVLKAMEEAGKLNAVEAATLREEPLRLKSRGQKSYLKSHARYPGRKQWPLLADRVQEAIDSLLGAGFAETSGATVVTTLDLKAQRLADSILRFHVDTLQRGRKARIEAALVLLDTRTGGVTAQIGGLQVSHGGYDRSVHARRAPGSSFKAVVYAAAIENGASPADRVDDSPLSLPDPDRPKAFWRPHNLEYDFDGRISYRRALYRSRNIPAVRVAIKAGLDSVIEVAHRLGLSDAMRGIPSLALGALETSPWEMAAAFRALAAGGRYQEPHYISVVRDRHGQEIFLPPHFEYAAVSPQTAYILCDMLRDVNIRGTAAGVWASGFTFPSGGKTGTSNDHRDAWYVGFTPLYTAAIWLGNDGFESFDGHFSGADAAMPIWRDLMQVLHRGQRRQDFEVPDDLTRITVCMRSGLALGPICDSTHTDWEILGQPGRQRCSPQAHIKAVETMPMPVRRKKNTEALSDSAEATTANSND